MSRNHRRRRGGRNRSAHKNEAMQPIAEEIKLPEIKKDEKGLFDFSEEELATDDSLQLITMGPILSEAKFANFEEYLKAHT